MITMTGLLPKRKRLFIFLIVTALLGLFALAINLQMPTPWHRTRSTLVIGNNSVDLWPVDHRALDNTVDESATSQPIALSAAHKASSTRTSSGPAGPDTSKFPSLSSNTQANKTKPLKVVKLAKPTEKDHLGDEYAVDDTPPQTSCPSSIRRTMAHTPFADRFLETVPVLQWAKHSTPEEYRRLRRYSGSHGWALVSFDTLNASLSILKTPANWLMFDDWEARANKSQCIRCAVVGNGGILFNSSKGEEIDQHDYVFRTNGAVIKGFQRDVGSRTSIYTFSTNTLRNSMRSYLKAGYRGPPLSKETKYVFLPDHDRDYLLMRAAATHTAVRTGPERSAKPPTYFGKNVTVEQFKMYHPDFVRYLRNRFLRSSALNTRYKNIYRPSTGAVMLLAALHTCDQVSAYGFMTPDYMNYSDHYYDKKKSAVHFYINHDLRMEMNLWQQLHKAGLIRLYMRQKT